MAIGEALKAQLLDGVARDEPFRRRFLEMAGLSLGVAGLSFVGGSLVRMVLGVDV